MHIKSKLPATLAMCCIPLLLSVSEGTKTTEVSAETTGVHAKQPARLKAKNMKLVWHDEFNKNRLDTTVWNIETYGNGSGNNELQHYSSRGVSLGREPKSGAKCLILTARRERYGNHEFTSGRINTQGKMTISHGIVEARIKLPQTANGLWPAFWLLGNNYRECGWPRCGEIDILEMGNRDAIEQKRQTTLFNGACHWGYYNSKGQYPNVFKAHDNEYSLQDGEFHTFTLEWDNNSLKMYVDRYRNSEAKPYFSFDIADKSTELAAGNYFHHDFFIIFNLAVGGEFTGITQPSLITALEEGEEAKMYVDWVRVYENKNK